MATVCSMCAPREPSALRSVQPSASVKIWSVRLQEPRLDRDHQAGLELDAAAGPAVVGDVRVAVHGAAHAVPAELQVHARARRPARCRRWPRRCRRAGCRRCAWPMPAVERAGGDVDEVEVLLARRTDDEADRRVGHPAVDAAREVEREQVAVPQHVVVGEPVQHRVVDRRAEHLAERRGAERRVVVDVAGLGTAVLDHPVRERVEVEQVDADVRGLGQRGEDLGDEPARRPHRLDLRGGAELDHVGDPIQTPKVVGVDLVLGTMYFGTRTDEATSFAMLDRYVEAGGRVLDTANCYSFWTSPTGHGGQSEAVIGRWLAANSGLRDELADSHQGRSGACRRRWRGGALGARDRAGGSALGRSGWVST